MSRGDSEDRQRERDREYAGAWAKLSARERKQLAKAGITGPDLPVYHTGKHDQDTFLNCCASPVATTDDDEVAPVHHGEDTQAVVRRLVGELLASDHIRLTLECLSLVTGISYGGSSMTEIARKCHVTRAAVSKRCVEISEAMAIPPARAMRKLTARAVYERRAKHCHNRNEH